MNYCKLIHQNKIRCSILKYNNFLSLMLASLMVHEWATPLNMSAPIAGILTIGGFMGYYSLSRKF